MLHEAMSSANPEHLQRELTLRASDPRPAVRRSAAEHPQAAPDLLVALGLDDNFWVRRQAIAHPHFPTGHLALLRRAGSSADLASFAPPDLTLEPEVLAELARLGEWGKRLAARHPRTPAQTLLTLAGHPSPRLRSDLALHRNAPPELLSSLAADGDIAVRRAAAKHPQLPAATLALLSRAGAGPDLDGNDRPDPTLGTREAAALIGLGAFGRRLAARLPCLTSAQLVALSTDPSSAVRRAVASHSACPPEALTLLAIDDDPTVRQAAVQHPGVPAAALANAAAFAPDDVEFLAAIAGNPNAPASMLVELAEHGSSRLRQVAAAHPALPRVVLERLRRAGSNPDLLSLAPADPGLPPDELARLAASGAWARLLAARHPATPPEVLSRLATDGDLLVRRAAAQNARTPPELLELLLRAGSTPDLEGFSAEEAGTSLSSGEVHELAALGPWARRLAARQANASGKLLDRLSQDRDPQVRAAVATHPAAAEPALCSLAQDAAALVRWALLRRKELSVVLNEILARDPLPAIRSALAAHPSATPAVLERLSTDLDDDVREAARGRRAEGKLNPGR